jgi:hypothetical protein
VINDRINKSKKIQEEQKKQMSIRQENEAKMIHDDIKQYNSTGINAIAPYYVNEDNRKEREKALKSSGVKVS